MDFGSIVDMLGSVDPLSVAAPLNIAQGLLGALFKATTSVLDLFVTGSAASADLIQAGLGSLAGK